MLLLAFLAASSIAFGQPLPAVSAGPQTDSSPELRRDRAYIVDPAGSGQFVSLANAIASVPGGSLLVLKSGFYDGVVLNQKSLRIESEVQHGARFAAPFVVQNIGPNQAVYLSGLYFAKKVRVEFCAGEVSLFGCTDNAAALADFPPNWFSCQNPCVGPGNSCEICGCFSTRHSIDECDAVTLVECEFQGGLGFTGQLDGTSGEHGLEIRSSAVSVYGGSYVGGDGGDSLGSGMDFAGAGGDGIRAFGIGSHLRCLDVYLEGGAGGTNPVSSDACNGRPVQTFGGALYTPIYPDSPSFTLLPPLARPGTAANYVIAAPVGATVLLKVGTERAWREFPAMTGILHIAAPFKTLPLGTMGASGVMTGSLRTPDPQWARSFAGLELQVHTILNGQNRFSEPRTLHVTAVH